MPTASSLALLVGCSADPKPKARQPGDCDATPCVTTTGSTAAPTPTLLAADPRAAQGVVVSVSSADLTTMSVLLQTADDTHRVDFAALSTAHVQPLVGLLPDRTYDVTVTLTDVAGLAATAAPLTWTTGPLPEPFPTVERLHDAIDVEPVWWLLPLRRYGANADDDPGHVALLDPQGRFTWVWTDVGVHASDIGQQPDGSLLGVVGNTVLSLDAAGRSVGQWAGADDAPVGATLVDEVLGPFHHDVERLEDGSLLGMTWTRRNVADFPSSYVDPTARAPTDVAVDILVNFSDDGTLLQSLPADALLPLDRIAYNALDGKEEDPSVADWGHLNDAFWVQDRQAAVLSFRHQDAVILADLPSQEPVWILAPPENWPDPWSERLLAPIGDVVWPFHAHAPVLEGADLLLFDNGNFRVSPWTGALNPIEETWSRVVRYAIDEDAGTVQTLWSLDQTSAGTLFSKATGWIERTAGGLLAVTYGVVQTIDGTPVSDVGMSSPVVHLLLVDDSGPAPLVVQETRIARHKPAELGFLVTRARPLAGPYPPSVAKVSPE